MTETRQYYYPPAMLCAYCAKPITIPPDATHKRFCSARDHHKRNEPIPPKSCRAQYHYERTKRALETLKNQYWEQS